MGRECLTTPQCVRSLSVAATKGLPFAARAQKAMPVIGFLSPGPPGAGGPLLGGFRLGLSEAGYTEGQNVSIEYHWVEAYDRLPAMAADLAGRKVTPCDVTLQVKNGTFVRVNPTKPGTYSCAPDNVITRKLDLIKGSSHLQASVRKGVEIIEGLRGHTTGYAVPQFVIDAPGGGGKVPVNPNYILHHDRERVVLRNYEGYITTYEEPPTYQQHDKLACSYCQNERSEPGQSGVLGLLEGERMWIEPKGFSEIHTRGNTEAHRLQDPAKWVPFGVGAIEGTAGASLRVIEPGPGLAVGNELPAKGSAASPTPAADAYGPGEEPRPREGEPTASAHGELL